MIATVDVVRGFLCLVVGGVVVGVEGHACFDEKYPDCWNADSLRQAMQWINSEYEIALSVACEGPSQWLLN